MACILFVDDDPHTLEMLAKSVQIFGHKALVASTGSAAMLEALQNIPDLIMTDMRLPDMDGITLLGKFRSEPTIEKIPVVMLTASPEVDLEQISQAAGANEYLTKPVRLQTLLDVIQRYTV